MTARHARKRVGVESQGEMGRQSQLRPTQDQQLTAGTGPAPSLPFPDPRPCPRIHGTKAETRLSSSQFEAHGHRPELFAHSQSRWVTWAFPKHSSRSLYSSVATGYLLFLSGDSGGNCSLGRRTRLPSFPLDQRWPSVGGSRGELYRKFRLLMRSRTFLLYRPAISAITDPPSGKGW